MPQVSGGDSGSDELDEAVRESLRTEHHRQRDERNWRRRRRWRRRPRRHDDDSSDASGSEDDDGSEEETEESDEDEEVVRRSRRSKKEISYKFEEYDELISTAIHQDYDKGEAGTLSLRYVYINSYITRSIVQCTIYNLFYSLKIRFKDPSDLTTALV